MSATVSRAASFSALLVALALPIAATAVPSAHAQSSIEPYFMVMVDTSGSMDETIGGSGTMNSCGVRSRRLADARCVMRSVVNAYGEVQFGLSRFRQIWEPGTCTSPCIEGDGLNDGTICGGCEIDDYTCVSSSAGGEVLVPIAMENQPEILRWLDYTCGGSCSAVTGTGVELRSGGGTPLTGAIRATRAYFSGASSPLIGDPAGTCRPVSVILLTDGANDCGDDPSVAATELRSTTVDGRTYDIRTYPIGFGVSAGDDEIEAIAIAGGVNAAGTHRGFYASDETSLSLAFSEIIASSIRYEVCNGTDDDCDTRIDEGFTRWCDRPGGVSTITECVDPGETVCDGADDNCDGAIDEGFTFYCDRPGGVTTATLCADPGETVCDGVDDNCDGVIDEGVCGGCVPSPEICDGLDNDCDGSPDDGLTRPCGTEVGECTTGTQTCAAGSWGVCAESTAPTIEACNGDDDDCDGVIDGITRPCGSDTGACQAGNQLCSAAVWGTCSGAVGPSGEVCNGIDDDCDGPIDELNPGGGASCGSSLGECTVGTLQCSAGALVCSGGTGPALETCNGLDDDCDGATDETVPTMGACGSTTGECRAGVQTCVAGEYQCVGARVPAAEVCNGRDDDCDGTNDELNPGGGGVCGTTTGECSAGTLQCLAGVLTCTGGVSPVSEDCNALDDDCDGNTDESVPTDGACGVGTGECEPGVRTCRSGAFTCVGARGPVDELCNARDDDCDASTDEENPGGGTSCGTDIGVCSPGLSQCVAGALQCIGGTVTAPEVCDSDDNDCDGLVDEGNPGGGGSCGATDVGECDLGALACQGGALVCRGETGPTLEICDGRDNDCDGNVDEMNPEGGVACGNDVGECTAGSTACVSGALICMGGTGPSAEICNGLDDDCDGVEDEGIPVGAPCGSDVGECSPGVNICRDGMLTCEGQIAPIDETCNALDDDCDSTTDEGLPAGAACGTDEGVCTAGTLQCVSGMEICVGEMPGEIEICDCEDNDCNGMTDEPPPDGALCPTGTACISCSCARECIPSEFGPQCPTGTVAQEEGGVCHCVRPRCVADDCAMETITVDGEDVCAPEGDLLGTCVCRNNDCTFPCDGVVCGAPLVCRPSDGSCVSNDCTGLGCPSGQLCDAASGMCTVDACEGVTCDDGEACRDGDCETSCADVACATGERCERGTCVEDLCEDAACATGEVCDPATGTCAEDGCVGVSCTPGLECEPVSGDCVADACNTLHCPDDEVCVDGECAALVIPEADAGSGGMDGGPEIDAGPDGEERTRVLAAGGGGCLCAVPGSGSGTSGSGGSALLALLGMALVARRLRRVSASRGAR